MHFRLSEPLTPPSLNLVVPRTPVRETLLDNDDHLIIIFVDKVTLTSDSIYEEMFIYL
jgi:hypothetical protein